MHEITDTQRKQAIIVASFGSTYPKARAKCIEPIEKRIRETFPEYDVYRAFTSQFVMKRMREAENLAVESLLQVLKRLQAAGYEEVIVQTTLLTPGEEYDNKIAGVCRQFAGVFRRLTIGRPLLTLNGQQGQPDDFLIAADALKAQMLLAGERTVVWLGHGSVHRHNPAYETLQACFDRLGINAVIGVLEEEDYPGFSEVERRLAAQGAKQVMLMPLLLVSGDHVRNDLAGDTADSWKNRLAAAGFQVETVLSGLGENPAVQAVYVQHVRDAIAGLE